MSNPCLSIVIPLYNEQEVFPELTKRLLLILEQTTLDIEVVMVDDGSSDLTAGLIKELATNDIRFRAVFLSRNFGHQMALTAGLNYVRATDAVFIMDGDLQDPPELIFDFYQKHKEGFDVVYAIRKKRKETLLKKMAYSLFYRLLKGSSKINIPLDSGDFGLISARVANILNNMPEENRFVRGMRSWVGFNQVGIEYERDERSQGVSKYGFKELWHLAKTGFFNFSEVPVKFFTRLGFGIVAICGVYFALTLINRFVYGTVPEGFTGLLFVIILFGGIQLLAIGLIGEYVLRIFFQVKKRPLFIVKTIIENGEEIDGKGIL
ncbi:MAG: glycosyltransferase involved in cell wall biosynthesis [Luteibaculaceae bacterium]|jgi:glycosyltransferase involved in cell wall biosynthesis